VSKIIKLLLFCIFIFSNINMTSQIPSGWCATTENNNIDPTGVYSYSIDPNLTASFEPVVYNIFFWGINKSDGTP